MNNAELVQILNTRNYLLEKLASLFFFETVILDNVVEELTSWHIFCDQIKLARRFNNFV